MPRRLRRNRAAIGQIMVRLLDRARPFDVRRPKAAGSIDDRRLGTCSQSRSPSENRPFSTLTIAQDGTCLGNLATNRKRFDDWFFHAKTSGVIGFRFMPRKRFGRNRKNRCRFCTPEGCPRPAYVDYKDVGLLKKLCTNQSKMFSRKRSGNCAAFQRAVERRRQAGPVHGPAPLRRRVTRLSAVAVLL